MIATHSIKVNGKWYRAGEKISPAEPQKNEPEQKKAEQPQYTKTDINRMSTADLRKMAVNTGVEGANEMTGAELKKYLISLFGL